MGVVAVTTTRPQGHGSDSKVAASWRPARLPAVALALFAVLVALSLQTHRAAARPLDEVKASGVLRIAVYESNLPFSWLDEHGTLTGIDVELGRALAADLGLQPEFIARMQGEDVDTDLRSNVWKGPVTGGQVADVMLHVPVDRELGIRNREVFLINPYFQERVELAYDAARLPGTPDVTSFRSAKIGVQLGTVADYFIMFADGGKLRDNVLHFVKMKDGIKRFLGGEFAAILGVRSETEGWLKVSGGKASFVTLPMPNIQRPHWNVGMAVKENSRDLGYALAASLDKIKAAGTLARMFETHGVTYAGPALE